MPALVVDGLEIVDVDQQQRQPRAVPAGVVQLPGELLLECAVVAEARQRVEQGVAPSPAVELQKAVALVLQSVDRIEEAPGEEPHGQRAADGGHGEEEHRRVAAKAARPESSQCRRSHEPDELDEESEDQACPNDPTPLVAVAPAVFARFLHVLSVQNAGHSMVDHRLLRPGGPKVPLCLADGARDGGCAHAYGRVNRRWCGVGSRQ